MNDPIAENDRLSESQPLTFDQAFFMPSHRPLMMLRPALISHRPASAKSRFTWPGKSFSFPTASSIF